ncbi:Beta-centractin [Microtus ochrogaster]|uniref:Beta-centractin n=1 Tax=Microtus ochrogaster TaxID=79684 RepID=A0A8J6L7C4_MICOH|nr:Beta-centractin [Microtus ochrogaster]
MVNSTMHVDIAGRDISCCLWLLLLKDGADFHALAEFEVVQTIKEQICYLSISSQNVPG